MRRRKALIEVFILLGLKCYKLRNKKLHDIFHAKQLRNIFDEPVNFLFHPALG